MTGAGDRAGRPFPPPELGQAILRVIAEVTGRRVHASQVSAWDSDAIEVIAMLDEDGEVAVKLVDPLRIGGG